MGGNYTAYELQKTLKAVNEAMAGLILLSQNEAKGRSQLTQQKQSKMQ